MPFVLQQTDSYSWPVEISFPVDGGRFETATFDAEFKRVPQDRVETIMTGFMEDNVSNRDAVVELLVGWRGITDGKEEIPFSARALAQLLDTPGAALCIIKSWMESLAGAKRKN